MQIEPIQIYIYIALVDQFLVEKCRRTNILQKLSDVLTSRMRRAVVVRMWCQMGIPMKFIKD